MKNLRQILHSELLKSKIIPCGYVQSILKVVCTSTEEITFKEFLQYASDEVSQWPKWKQGLLGGWGQEVNKELVSETGGCFHE